METLLVAYIVGLVLMYTYQLWALRTVPMRARVGYAMGAALFWPLSSASMLLALIVRTVRR